MFLSEYRKRLLIIAQTIHDKKLSVVHRRLSAAIYNNLLKACPFFRSSQRIAEVNVYLVIG